jgi:hypothetical protein
MEGLLNLASEFVRDPSALGRCLDVDRQREQRLGNLATNLECFGRGELSLDELMRRMAQAVREQHPGRTGIVWLWGFKNEEERSFPERLAAAAARVPEVDLNGVLRSLLKDAEHLADDERVNRLLAFADFVADLDSRGQEGDPRIGVGPSANFLTFSWHLLAQAREPVFLFETNKAIKAVGEASGEPELKARDLEGRFRSFYRVARRLAPALASAPVPMRAGWALEHALEFTLERMGAIEQASGGAEDPGTSGLWKPRPRAELKDRPPSGRMPFATADSGEVKRRPSITIEPPRRGSDERPIEKTGDKPLEPAEVARIESMKTERIFAIGKAKTIIAQDPVPEPRREEARPPEVREIRTPRGLPRIGVRQAPAAPAEIVEPARALEPAPTVVPAPEPARSVAAEARPLADAKGQTAPLRRPHRDTSGELLTAALGELIGEIATAESEPEAAPASSHASTETWRSERLSRDLGFPDKLVADALDSLATRGRVLLTGVFATGKTYLARRIALHLAGRDERTLFLRLHPSLGYDDLVECRRPDGVVERGIVRDLGDRARKEREARFVLVLDDADRTDLGAALGELAGALGERGAEVVLGRSRDRFAIPKNLYVVATARTIPAALAGRFPGVEVEPDSDVLRRFLARSHSALEWVADLLRETNARLVRDRGPQARIGQGILMDAELDLPRLEGIWRREVLPFVRSLGLDARDYELGALRR